MTEKQRFEQVRDIIIDKFEIEKRKVMPDMRLQRDLGMDNIDRFSLAYRLEVELGFQTGGAWDGWQTVQDIVDTWEKQEVSE